MEKAKTIKREQSRRNCTKVESLMDLLGPPINRVLRRMAQNVNWGAHMWLSELRATKV
jgi:hypothetical protein